MLLSQLKKDQQKEAEAWLKLYKHASLCKKCNYIYGFDLDTDNGLCPDCLQKKVKIIKKKNLKSKRK